MQVMERDGAKRMITLRQRRQSAVYNLLDRSAGVSRRAILARVMAGFNSLLAQKRRGNEAVRRARDSQRRIAFGKWRKAAQSNRMVRRSH
ncbi:unnamed protein product, partial [Chrysoparadoxa australica]